MVAENEIKHHGDERTERRNRWNGGVQFNFAEKRAAAAAAFSQDGGALLLLLVPSLPAADGTINHRRLSVNAKRKEGMSQRKRDREKEAGRREGREDQAVWGKIESRVPWLPYGMYVRVVSLCRLSGEHEWRSRWFKRFFKQGPARHLENTPRKQLTASSEREIMYRYHFGKCAYAMNYLDEQDRFQNKRKT